MWWRADWVLDEVQKVRRRKALFTGLKVLYGIFGLMQHFYSKTQNIWAVLKSRKESSPLSRATSSTFTFLCSAIYPRTVKITNPDAKLVRQFTRLVTIASLYKSQTESHLLTKYQKCEWCLTVMTDRARRGRLPDPTSTFMWYSHL